MVKISVDEAYAFDYYSILCIKKEIKEDIINHIGAELFNKIINSNEYINLYVSNKKTFDAVDKAKNDDVLASYVDKCNYLRMVNKKYLQTKFFLNELVESKIGYEKIKLENE